MTKQHKEQRMGIFYFSMIAGPDRQRLALPGGGACYVRIVEVCGADGTTEALDMAQPRNDESVMNTHVLL